LARETAHVDATKQRHQLASPLVTVSLTNLAKDFKTGADMGLCDGH
jgi:hypothetical protein